MKTTMEVVYLPSVQHPGLTFKTFTSAEIRRRNLIKWKHTPYQEAKAARTPGTADDIRLALATAQAASLVHRGYHQAVAA